MGFLNGYRFNGALDCANLNYVPFMHNFHKDNTFHGQCELRVINAIYDSNFHLWQCAVLVVLIILLITLLDILLHLQYVLLDIVKVTV